MSLLKLPWVASAASPFQARRIDAIICVTVVLPLLPVTAIKAGVNRPLHALASAPRARLASGTTSPGMPDPASSGSAPGSQMAAAAPFSAACARNAPPSNVSPRSATNRSPGSNVRVSV